VNDDYKDPLFDDAVSIVRAQQSASISMLQRHLIIGYNRAARLIEAMEPAGVVGPTNSRGVRKVLPLASA
jgi:DNA segregation ATPase FtsK/SpoIIIE-like protein